ncbi:MAG: DUF2249 domain-containing protein [bacterium]
MTKQPPGEPGPADRAAAVELELRDMEPPQPMIEILSALEKLKPGEQLVAVLPHKPGPLFPRLAEAGCTYTIGQREDRGWELRVTKG